ncbi:MAG: hypothetical protein RI907_1660, partial [Pseudomonadota bacterium]
VDASGMLWVSDHANPGHLLRIDPATGLAVQSITINAANFGVSYLQNFSGLQIVTKAFALHGVTVPVGSLLVFTGQPNTDLVVAINPSTGAVITEGSTAAKLSLAVNYDLTAGVYDAASGKLFVTRTNGGSGTDIVAIDPATGAQLASSATGITLGNAGLAIEPATGHLWLGTQDLVAQVVEYQIGATGALTELRRVNLSNQGINQNEITGLSFDASGKLWVASTQGEVYKVSLA